jgi:hypothetical protein
LAQDFANEELAGKAVRKYDIKNADLVTINEDGHVIGGKPFAFAPCRLEVSHPHRRLPAVQKPHRI